MSTPFLGEIRLVSFTFAPKRLGAVQRADPADQPEPGAVLAARHDLRRQRADHLRAARPARADARHTGNGYTPRRDAAARAAHTLTAAELPAHTHSGGPSPARATTTSPTGAHFAASRTGGRSPRRRTPRCARRPSSPAGGGQPHENMPPYLTLNFVIALQGIFPSQN